MELVVKTYQWLPCSVETFQINGIDASLDYFGYTSDADRYRAEPYSCANRRFCRHNDAKLVKQAMKLYGITLEEYYDICDKLEEELYVGSCGLCV